MIVYAATNIINGKMYVGQTTRSLSVRISEHICHAIKSHNNSVFAKAIRLYGPNNFKWNILYRAKDIEELNNAEKYFILDYDCFAHKKQGYNLETGGMNYKVSSITRQKMSDLKKQDKYIDIAKNNLPKDTSGSKNGRYKNINVQLLAIDYKLATLINIDLQHKYGISRPTIKRKLLKYFGNDFYAIQQKREKLLEIFHGRQVS